MFDIPVVLFLFKRLDATKQILERLREVQPSKLYVICDQGRNDEEMLLVNGVRTLVDEEVDWPCEIIRDYATSNRGVYEQIGLGALRVFEKEEAAIFLEDDNLPETTFFSYCKQMLANYADDERIVWVCGTNYLGSSTPHDGSDIYFTKHLLPCGWASWASKFKKYYDKDFSLAERPGWERTLKTKYEDRRLYVQQIDSVKREIGRKKRGERYNSWDFHMAFSIRMNNLYGIAPSRNQITNIGVDEFSTHGSKTGDAMSDRFCGVPSYPMPEPCSVPDRVSTEMRFESAIGRVILYPLGVRARIWIKKKLGVPDGVGFKEWMRGVRRYEG